MNPRPSCHLPRQRHWRRLLQCRGGISVFLADHCGNDGANPLLGPEPPAMRSHKTATVCISFWRNHRLPASAKPWEVRRQSPCLMPGPDAPPLPFWIPGSRNDGGGSGSATPSPQPSPATGRGSKRPRPIRSSRIRPAPEWRWGLWLRHPLTPALSRDGEREQEATPDSFLSNPACAGMAVKPTSKVRRRSGRPLGRPCRGRRPRARCECSLAAG